MTYVRDAAPGTNGTAGAGPFPRWVEPRPLPAGVPRYHEDDLLHEILARRLATPEEGRDFLDARERPAPDPDRLPGMPAAVERVAFALRRGEAIGIFGDYDTDGVTSAALLTLALRAASGGAQPVAVRLPGRHEGYGLSEAGVEDLAAAGTRLLVAVDCGSKDHRAVARAVELGLAVVVLDHHRLTEPPPPGAIVASPQLEADSPYANLSAAGIAYLLAAGLAGEGFDTGAGAGNEPADLLELAMIGIVGDVSSLTGINRPLVRDGLRRLRDTARPGLRALASEGGIDLRGITSVDVAFKVSPRLNAPGRLGDPRPAYDLLVARGEVEASRLAKVIERANQGRKQRQDLVLREVEAMLEHDPSYLDRRVMVFAGPGWEPGIVGLAASKLADRFNRPVLVLSQADGVAHGSARSIPGFDIAGALAAVTDLLQRHGGHARAAGLALDMARVRELDEALQAAIGASAAELPGPPRLEIDADLPPRRLTLDVARRLQTLGPFGEGNPVPLLRIREAPVHDYLAMGRERQHLKIRLGHGGRGADALLWNGAARSRELLGAQQVDVVGTLETSVWNGIERLQVRVSDFRVPAR